MLGDRRSGGVEKVLISICYIITAIVFFVHAYDGRLHLLQSYAALEAVQNENVSLYKGSCIECYEDRNVGYNAKMSITYYFRMDNGLLFKSVEDLFDTSIIGFEKLKADMQQPWTFCYIPLDIWGIEENWVISIFSEDEILVSDDTVEIALADEITRWRFVMRGAGISGIVMVLCPVLLGVINLSNRRAQKRRIALKKKRREEQKARKLAKAREQE